jgi:hypothetical protein
MSGSKLHDWLRPRLQAVLRDAEAEGFEREVVVAVMIDVVTGSAVNDAPLPQEPAPPTGPFPGPPGDDDLNEFRPEVSGHMPNLLGDVRGRRID